jgi:protein-tyrosine phosphatase
MNNLIDIHNHTLWDMDDGLKTKDDARQQLTMAYESGITQIAVTPHIQPHGRFVFSESEIIEATTQLQQLALDLEIPMQVSYGSEFMITPKALQAIEAQEYVCYQDTDWLLIEQRFSKNNPPTDQDPRLVLDAIDLLLLQNKHVLIAHVERYFDSVSEALDVCASWVKRGAHLQINRTSIMMLESKLRGNIARQLIKNNYCHVIASDAHDITGSRVLRLDDSYHWVSKHVSVEVADVLHHENPRRVLANQTLVTTQHKAHFMGHLFKRR